MGALIETCLGMSHKATSTVRVQLEECTLLGTKYCGVENNESGNFLDQEVSRMGLDFYKSRLQITDIRNLHQGSR